MAADEAFIWPVRVYWEDTDAGGIVFYANYLKFFERARTEWLRSLGLGQQALRERTGGMFVVTETQLQYRQPARLDDLLHISATVTELGRASITLKQEARRYDAAGSETLRETLRETLLCEGTIRIGWVLAESLKPQRLPPDIALALQPRTKTHP